MSMTLKLKLKNITYLTINTVELILFSACLFVCFCFKTHLLCTCLGEQVGNTKKQEDTHDNLSVGPQTNNKTKISYQTMFI